MSSFWKNGSDGSKISDKVGAKRSAGSKISDNVGAKGGGGSQKSANFGTKDGYGLKISDNFGSKGGAGSKISDNVGAKGSAGSKISDNVGAKGGAGTQVPGNFGAKGGYGSKVSDNVGVNGSGQPDIEYEVPGYQTHRTHANWKFCVFSNGPRKPQLIGVPIESQERLILHELFAVLTGMRGVFIEPNDDIPSEGDDFNLSFKISESIHPSLRGLIERILPLSSYYICIQKFVEKAQCCDSGAVWEALSSSLNDVVHDYFNVLAELETEVVQENYTLSKVHYNLCPISHTMETVANLLHEIMMKNEHGVAALNALYNSVTSYIANENQVEFIGLLLAKAAVPYIRTLEMWLQKGVIFDPSHEFMIEDNQKNIESGSRDPETAPYWDQRFTIRSEHIPVFLKGFETMILKTGKYLNVVFKCSKSTKPMKLKLEFEQSNEEKFKQLIDDAYNFASGSLLQVIQGEYDLLSHLQSVKNFLLLGQGDFMMKFLDECDEQLSQDYNKISADKVHCFMQMILRNSSLNEDAHKDLLGCTFLSKDLNTQIKTIMGVSIAPDVDVPIINGYQSIAFDYIAPWPISLIINEFTIGKYQLIFRLLFLVKHVENELCKTWKSCHKINSAAMLLRHQLLSTIQNFGYYITVDVIESNWQLLAKEVKETKDYDNFIQIHNKFLDEVLKMIFISYLIHLIDDMTKIFNICLEFCKVIQNKNPDETEKSLTSQITKLGIKFHNAVNLFLYDIRRIDPPHKIYTLADRINFNKFFTEISPNLAEEEEDKKDVTQEAKI